MNFTFIFTLLAALYSTQVVVHSDQSLLIDFRNREGASGWNVVNDGVMGGRSVGKLRKADNGALNFFGRLSLENNGGCLRALFF